MIVINLFGGPGTGKSTIASEIFSRLKWQNINCELVREYAKDKVWENSLDALDDQLYVFAKQYHRQFILKDKVNVIITDSPILLSTIYGKNKTELFNKLVVERFNEFNNINVFLTRTKDYHSAGRYQNEVEAIEIDNIIKQSLIDYNIEFITIDGDGDACDKIMEVKRV